MLVLAFLEAREQIENALESFASILSTFGVRTHH